MTAAPASIGSREAEVGIRNELRLVEQREAFAPQPHIADEITVRALGRFIWQSKRWWLVAVGVVVALNGVLLTLSASWPNGGPAGF